MEWIGFIRIHGWSEGNSFCLLGLWLMWSGGRGVVAVELIAVHCLLPLPIAIVIVKYASEFILKDFSVCTANRALFAIIYFNFSLYLSLYIISILRTYSIHMLMLIRVV